MKISPEQIYNCWHRETKKAEGIFVKSIKNFDKIKSKPEWPFFISCSNLINRNYGQMDYEIYLKSLAEHYKGWFQPKLLLSRKSILIYKNYTNQLNLKTNKDHIKTTLLNSIKFVCNFCIEKNINDIYDYLNHDIYFIPTILKHYSAGSISIYFLVSIKNFPIVIQNYPIDAVKEYLPKFEEDYNIYRSRVVNYDETKKIADNLEEIIETLILKKVKH